MISATNLRSVTANQGSDNPATEFPSSFDKECLSADTVKVLEKIHELKNTLSSTEKNYENRVTLAERLFDARADAKILFSKVSMHFNASLREKLFRQIDLIHDTDDWEEGEEPIQSLSFNTFLRWFFLNDPTQLPNFGLSSAGLFIASWLTNKNKDRLILEFLPNDRIKWFVIKYYDEEADQSSGSTNLSRITEKLAPYRTDAWFKKQT